MSEEKKEKLPVIRVGKITEVPYCIMELFIENEDFYNNCVELARKEISDEALFEWWVVTALKETVKMYEEEPEKLEKMVADYKAEQGSEEKSD